MKEKFLQIVGRLREFWKNIPKKERYGWSAEQRQS